MRWRCLMEKAAVYFGEWDDYHEDYRWQPLGGHRVEGDARSGWELLMAIAGTPLTTERDEAEAPAATSAEAPAREAVREMVAA